MYTIPKGEQNMVLCVFRTAHIFIGVETGDHKPQIFVTRVPRIDRAINRKRRQVKIVPSISPEKSGSPVPLHRARSAATTSAIPVMSSTSNKSPHLRFLCLSQ
jgi:hypothetical protein